MNGTGLLILLGSLAGPPGSMAGPDELADVWAALDGASEADWSALREAVVAAGEPGALRGLMTFADVDATGRLVRASIARTSGGPSCIDQALVLLDDRDPAVRLELVRFLGERRLVGTQAPERLAILMSVAVDDANPRVRAAAVDAVASIDHPESLARLDGLLDELPADERRLAAARLADHALGRERLVRRVSRAFGEPSERPLDSETLAVLLDGYGQALVHLPGGGESANERRPLVIGRDHPAPIVRLAARSALDNLIIGLAAEGELARGYSVLDGLIADGYPNLDAEYRKATLSLTSDPSPESARVAAAAILAAARPRGDAVGREWRMRGALLAAAAECAAEKFEAARGFLDEAERVLDGLAAERPELLPSTRAPATGNVDQAVSIGLQRCTVDLWRAVTWLAEGRTPSDGALLGHLRGMHVRALKTQLIATRYNSRVPASGFQPLLSDLLGPLRLLLSNSESPVWTPARALQIQVQLGTALASISAYELPGFEPLSTEEALRDPLVDPERKRLLEQIHTGSMEAIRTEMADEWDRGERDEAKLARLRLYEYYLLDETRKMREGSEAPLRRLREASNFALELSHALRTDGSPAAARELSDRMKTDLFANAAKGGGTVSEILVARLEVSVGSSWMDEDESEKAEKAFLQAETRLAAYEEDQLEQLGGGEDQELGVALARQIIEVRSLRADVLLSLAVNANVRQQDQDKALKYFESAFELKQTDFMRVLLACYRARSGHDAEARGVLSEVEPVPSLYYNLACTHALLGDLEVAVDYLARELGENHSSERSRDRQRVWASEDPDLSNLRAHPRFQRLVATGD